MGNEYQVVIANLSVLMDVQIYEPILHVKDMVTGQIIILVTRSYYRVLHVARVPITLWNRYHDKKLG